MSVEFTETEIPGVILIHRPVFQDHRGSFMEIFNKELFSSSGLATDFVQDNLSHSFKGVLRGLHYQRTRPQGKLVSVLRGEVFDVAVDIRIGSPTFGKWVGFLLSQNGQQQLYIPGGFAHGFCVLSEEADFYYKCTEIYLPEDEGVIHWQDPRLGISWPIAEPILSDKDRKAPTLEELKAQGRLPRYQG